MKLWRLLACGLPLLACEPEYVVGTWDCGSPELPDDPTLVMSSMDPVGTNWQTSFERGFCDYVLSHGFCYASPEATYEVVDSPVRSGRFSAAFSVTTERGADGGQSRCVREGTLPQSARYGAWFFIPELVENRATWNLMHFQGSIPPGDIHYLWDVSLSTGDDDQLYAYLFEFVGGVDDAHVPTVRRPIPIGRWFRLEFRWLRSDTNDGAVSLYLDDELLIELEEHITDDSTWAQWYVGNWADRLTPPSSTVYIDDVYIQPY